VVNMKFFILIFFLVPLISISGQDSVSPASSETILHDINHLRKQHGVLPLENDRPSTTAALLHVRELADRQLLSHWGLDGSRVAERYRISGGTGLKAGENLGAGENSETIINAWMNSQSHRENLLNPEWLSAGVGIIRNPEGRMIVVVVFNNSRWKQNSFNIIDGKVVLDGLLKLMPGYFPETVFLKISDSEVSPVSASRYNKNSLSLEFNFPLPEKWQSDRVAAMEINILENGKLLKTDLILWDIPVNLF